MLSTGPATQSMVWAAAPVTVTTTLVAPTFRPYSAGQVTTDSGPSCPVPVDFAPVAASNRQSASASDGQYSAVDIKDGAKQYSARPHFPPLVIDSPVEAAPRGELRVLADYDERYNNHQLVLSVPVSARSCAPFPVYGLVRLQHYYYFK